MSRDYFVMTRFEQFWKAYPKKAAKPVAKRAFEKLKPNEGMMQKIMESLEQHQKYWKTIDAKFIPHPATWLNQQRFLDDISDQLRGNTYTPQYVDSNQFQARTDAQTETALKNLKQLRGMQR